MDKHPPVNTYSENGLRESELRTHLALEAANVVAFTWDIKNDVVYRLNSGVEAIPNVDGKTLDDVVSNIFEPDRARFLENLKKSIANPQESYHAEYRLLLPDRKIIWLSEVGRFETDENGEATYLTAISAEITERKITEELLRASEARLHLGVEVAEFAICQIDYLSDQIHLSKEAALLYDLGDGELTLPREIFHQTFHHDDAFGLDELIKQAMQPEGDGWFAVEHRILHRDGAVRWISLRHQIYFDHTVDPPRPTIGILAAQDVTERKRAEEELRASEEFNRTVLENSPDCVKILDSEGRLQYMNVNGLCLMEIDDFKAFKDKYWWDLWEPETQAVVKDSIRRSLRGETAQFQASCPTAKGTTKWWDVIVTPVHGSDGKTERLISVSRDITGSKLAEEKLRESEDRFRQLVEQTVDGIFLASAEGRYIDVNPAGCEMFGMTREEILNTNFLDVLDIEEDDRLPETISELSSGKIHQGEWRFRRKDGSIFIGELVGRQLHDGRFLSIVRDITERKKAEEQLLRAEERFRLLTENLDNVFWIFNWKEKRGEYVSKAVNQLYSDEYAESLSVEFENWTNVIHEEDRERATRDFLTIEQTGKYETTYRLVLPDGSIRWRHAKGSPIRDKNGEILQVVGVSEDITDRKLAERQVIEAERRAAQDYRKLLARIAPLAQTLGTARELTTIYRALLDFIRFEIPCEGFFVSFYDAENHLKQVKYVWSLGKELDARSMQPIPLFKSTGANSRAISQGKSIISTRELEKMSGQFQVVSEIPMPTVESLVTPMIVMGRSIGTLEVQNHTEKYSPEHVIALEMAAGLAAVAIENVRLMDIESEARTVAEQANRAKDEFLAMLSHELRSPLNAMYGWTQILQTTKPDAEQTEKAIEIIARNVRLQKMLIEDLLDVSRIISGKMQLEIENVSLISIINEAVDATRPNAEKQGIEIEIDLSAETDEIFGDRHRLLQVIGNILTNAVKFTPEGGKIHISLEDAGDKLRLAIEDTGIGIAPELLPRIFDRFRQADGGYKRKFGGLGLGLTIVKHLVELHEGTISAYSEGTGKGAKFTVEFPRITPFSYQDNALAFKFASDGFSQKIKSLEGARVLAVDDDADVLDLVNFVLSEEGASVTCCHSAGEALEVLRAGAAFDLLISDLGMAELDGFDLIRAVRENAAERIFPAIALTGFVSAQDRQRVLAAGFQNHLSKPVDLEKLLSVAVALIKSDEPQN